ISLMLTSRRPQRRPRQAGPSSPLKSTTRRATASFAEQTTCRRDSPRACLTRAFVRKAIYRSGHRGSSTWSNDTTRAAPPPTLWPRPDGTAALLWTESWRLFQLFLPRLSDITRQAGESETPLLHHR